MQLKTKNMNWPDIKTAIDKGYNTIVIAVGAIEQHGPHLPTITDSLIGENLTYRIAEKLGNCLQGPTITIGCSSHHLAFPGTISIQKSTLKAIMHDYTDSLVKHGFKNIIFVPSHGGNFSTVEEAVKEAQIKHKPVKIIGYTDLMGFLEIMQTISKEAGIPPKEAGAHAGENETSLVLALAEDLVVKDRFEPGYVGKFGKEESEIIFAKGMKALTENGALGDPTRATKNHGLQYLEKTVDAIIDNIKLQLN
ncbi:MAG: creatininase family protein [Candidatus Heimdallarchaeota archaeon]